LALGAECAAGFLGRAGGHTPLSSELLGLLTGRKQRESARAVAMSLWGPDIHEAYVSVRDKVGGKFHTMEVLWMKEHAISSIVDGPAVQTRSSNAIAYAE